MATRRRLYLTEVMETWKAMFEEGQLRCNLAGKAASISLLLATLQLWQMRRQLFLNTTTVKRNGGILYN